MVKISLMFTQRHTAFKLLIKDLLSNEFVHREGESDFISVGDKRVSRVRIMATIVNKFVNDERQSGTIVIDDGSEVINVRAWENEFHLIDKLVIGQLVDVIGRVRVYNDEVYLTPEVVKVVGPDWLVLRKLELSKLPVKGDVQVSGEVVSESSSKVVNSSVKVDLSLKDSVFELIKSKGDSGALMDELVSFVGDKLSCQGILKELLEEDMIFEPRAGKYKVL